MASLSARQSRARQGTAFTVHGPAAPSGAQRAWRAMAGGACVLAALLLAACHPPPSPGVAEAASPQAVPLRSAPCVKAVPKPYKWEGYSEQPQDACLGPTHFRIPAHLFRDQMGPDFQGNFTLVLMWPDLQGAAPGKLNGQPMDLALARVRISPYYVDRVPVAGLLERFIAPSEDERRDRDPAELLELRDRQPERFGLTPYFVNPALFVAFETAQARRFGHPLRAKLEHTDDWYLHRDNAGRLTTLIKCDSHLEPDGYAVRGRSLVKDPAAQTSAQCSHHFVIEDLKLDVEISYARALLGEWQRFEDRARALLEQYRVR